jgi:type I restriction enzyme S subunit
MNNQLTLNQAAFYSEDRINGLKVSRDYFVTTDSMVQNKGGITITPVLPKGNLIAFSKGDILVGNIRPYLKKIWHADRNGGCSPDVLVIKAKSSIDSKFLYYSLFRDDFFNHMMNGSKGTKMPRGDKNQILRFQIPEIQLSTQQKIASVLSALDSKIELNNRINAELEAMAKTLYDYWFVQFDFPFDFAQGKPNANGKPYKSSGGKMVWNEGLKREIPEGWEVQNLSKIANITTGKLDSNAEVIGAAYPFYTCASDPSTTDTFAFDDTVILVAGNNAAGNFHINRHKGKFNAYQRTYIFTSKNQKELEYLYQVLKTETKALKSQGKGSQTKFLTIGMLTSINTFTKTGIMNKYNDVVKPMYEQQVVIRMQNQKLTELRDWLLPMLMNGQVKVMDEMENELSMAAEPKIEYGK